MKREPVVDFKCSFLRFAMTALVANASCSIAFAISEREWQTAPSHDTVYKTVVAEKGNAAAARKILSQYGVATLDSAWNGTLPDVKTEHLPQVCDRESVMVECRAMTVYKRASGANDHPVVILPGFTGYRKIYVEDAVDLIRMGYGPVYTIDFQGTGDSYKQDLSEPGARAHKASDFIGQSSIDRDSMLRPLKDAKRAMLSIQEQQILTNLEALKSDLKDQLNPVSDFMFDQMVAKHSGLGSVDAQTALVASTLKSLGIIRGYVSNFDDYNRDVDAVMKLAITRNPNDKISIWAISAGGLTIMRSLLAQEALMVSSPSSPRLWVNHVRQILLESPMIRIVSLPSLTAEVAQKLRPVMYTVPDLTLADTFARKAMADYVNNNNIGHSMYRVPSTDRVRVWSDREGFPTAGWVSEVLKKEYQMNGFAASADKAFDFVNRSRDFEDALSTDKNMKAIRDVLTRNGISMVLFASHGDRVVNAAAAAEFMTNLSDRGVQQLRICWFKTAWHQPDLESDFYRDPFMKSVGQIISSDSSCVSLPEQPTAMNRSSDPLVCGSAANNPN